MGRKEKEAAKVLKGIIAERGIVEVVIEPKIKIPKRKFFFSAHGKQRLWERCSVRISEFDFDSLKIISKEIVDSNNINLPVGYFCFGNRDFALVCHQRSINRFDVITVYLLHK